MNCIRSVVVDGRRFSDKECIREAVVQFFSAIFRPASDPSPPASLLLDRSPLPPTSCSLPLPVGHGISSSLPSSCLFSCDF